MSCKQKIAKQLCKIKQYMLIFHNKEEPAVILCTYLHACLYVCACVYVCMCVLVRMRVRVRVHVRMRADTFVYLCVYVFLRPGEGRRG